MKNMSKHSREKKKLSWSTTVLIQVIQAVVADNTPVGQSWPCGPGPRLFLNLSETATRFRALKPAITQRLEINTGFDISTSEAACFASSLRPLRPSIRGDSPRARASSSEHLICSKRRSQEEGQCPFVPFDFTRRLLVSFLIPVPAN